MGKEKVDGDYSGRPLAGLTADDFAGARELPIREDRIAAELPGDDGWPDLSRRVDPDTGADIPSGR